MHGPRHAKPGLHGHQFCTTSLAAAIADVASDGSACAHRAAANDLILGSGWKDPSISDENLQFLIPDV